MRCRTWLHRDPPRTMNGSKPALSPSLLQRVAAGDPAAMQPCIDEFGGLVWSLARRLCPTASEAEDAVQEVFISLWENAGRFDPDKGSETTFVAMIARRRIIDRGRQRARQQRLIDESRTRETPPTERRSDDAIGDEAARALRAMSRLSADQQRVLQLAIHYGYTHEQIATITRMPLGTVKTNVRRGLIRIRDLLADERFDRQVEAAR